MNVVEIFFTASAVLLALLHKANAVTDNFFKKKSKKFFTLFMSYLTYFKNKKAKESLKPSYLLYVMYN